MAKRDLNWLKRHTNVEDLLDDGVENLSHLAALDLQPESKPAPSPEFLAIRRRTVESNRIESERNDALAYRRAFDHFGLALGVVMALSGVALLAFPVDMIVHHARIKYLASVAEHVTPARSRIYGATLCLGGLALVGFSLHRPRRLQ
jgi:hypothetical protein